MNLLKGLGVALNFEPTVLFDDLKIGVNLRPLSAVGELRREDGVVVPPDQAFDLDAGTVRAAVEAGVDFDWRDTTLRAGAGARIVLLSGSFSGVTHADLEHFVVGPSATVPP